MDVRDFDFDLPADLIAQEPAAGSRRGAPARRSIAPADRDAHSRVAALPDSPARRRSPRRQQHARVSGAAARPSRAERRRGRVPADRLTGQTSDGRPTPGRRRGQTGRLDSAVWEALVHPGQKLKPGARVVFEGVRHAARRGPRAAVLRAPARAPLDRGRRLRVDAAVDAHRPRAAAAVHQARRSRATTAIAIRPSSRARADRSPRRPPGCTSRRRSLAALDARAASRSTAITLHVGYGTFQPVRVERVEDHRLEPERYEIERRGRRGHQPRARRAAAASSPSARRRRGRSRRWRARTTARIVAGTGATDLFIYPGFDFRVVSGLLTNFHLPRSSLLMLVSAFAGRERSWPRIERRSPSATGSTATATRC